MNNAEAKRRCQTLLIFFCMLWHDKNLNHKIWVRTDRILGGPGEYSMNNALAKRRCLTLESVSDALLILPPERPVVVGHGGLLEQ
jgi:hypothetical protein